MLQDEGTGMGGYNYFYFSDFTEISRFFQNNIADIVRFYDNNGQSIQIQSDKGRKLLNTLIIDTECDLSKFYGIFNNYYITNQYKNNSRSIINEINKLQNSAPVASTQESGALQSLKPIRFAAKMIFVDIIFVPVVGGLLAKYALPNCCIVIH